MEKIVRKKGQFYYFITSSFVVDVQIDTFSLNDYKKFEAGNYFLSIKDAQEKLKLMKLLLKNDAKIFILWKRKKEWHII